MDGLTVLLTISLAFASSWADPLCQNKPDGKYPVRDTFMYLQCGDSKGRLINCPKNQVFIAREDRCRPVIAQDQLTFCEGLPDGDYRDPWHCNKFFKCVAGTVYTFSCGSKDMIYKPATDRCVFKGEYACTVVTGITAVGGGSCVGKPDGKYPLSDTFAYLDCKSQVGTIKDCPTNEVYIHRERRCRTVTIADQERICEGLPNGDYRHPWNCHMFFKCFDEITYPFNCQQASVLLVFNPNNDQCVYPYQFACKEVTSIDKGPQAAACECTGQPDGNYTIPDVFSYLECKGGKGTSRTCPENQIFVAQKKACSVVTTADEDIFCENRKTGNYRNPWNCHHFITCVTGHPSPYDRPCHPLTLVYDPNNDRCEHATLFPCKNLTSPAPPKNRCTGKPDGLYILPDVFKYLECKGGQEILHFCPYKQFFASDTMKCRAVVPLDRVTFCNNRPVGNYRNPWNCHHFITCATGHPVYDRPCHPLSLVYDPDNDLCEHDYLMTCVEV